MAVNDPQDTAAAVYLLVHYPPVQSGRHVVGGWELETWRGNDCGWAIELANFGAYYWVDPDLAQIVANRTLDAQNVPVNSWLPCGSGHTPMFLARLGASIPATRRPTITRRPTASHHRTVHTTRRIDPEPVS